jgi:hypothetical protein
MLQENTSTNSSNLEKSNTKKLDKSNFSSAWEFLSFLLTTKEGKLTLAMGLGSLTGIFLLVFYVTKPQKIEIKSDGGSISFVKDGAKGTIFLLSPTGGESSPWVETGVKVNKGDKIKITASGRVHISLKKLIYSAQNEELNELHWSGPQGLSKEEAKSLPEIREKYKVQKNSESEYFGYGTLLAAIRDSRGRIIIEPIRKEKEFKSEIDGDILLTINDIWLSEEMKSAYVPDPKRYKDYYIKKIQEKDSLSNFNFSTLSEKAKEIKIKEEYKRRENNWNRITHDENWRVWYDDNTGSFSVAITINAD